VSELFPYQEQGFKWLSTKKRALLADEMGLGKTVQAIKAADAVEARRILIYCPAVGCHNWADEFGMWSETPRSIHIKTSRTDDKLGAITICSYDMADAHQAQFRTVNWDVVVCDESHYMKSRDSIRTKAILGQNGKGGILTSAARLWALSGTPAPNHYGELYPLLKAFGVWPHDYWEFMNTFTIWYDAPFGADRIIVKKSKNAYLLREILMPLMLRRKKGDVLKELPPIFFQYEAIEAGEVDDEIWFPSKITGKRDPDLPATLEKERSLLGALMAIESKEKLDDRLGAIEASKVATATLRRWHGQSKVAPVCDMAIDALESGAIDKLVIFAIHRNVIMDLEMRLKRFKPVIVFGGTPPMKKAGNVKKFQNNPKCRVFIGQIQAAGTTITLTAAQHIWFVEQDWVPGNNAQALMRVHRIGQSRKVFAKFFGVAGTLDDAIVRIVQRKTKDLQQLFD